MSVGLPVIATDVGAVPGIVRDGVDGIVVPPGDVNALAAAISRLIGDHRERRRLANQAPEVLERFSCEKVMGMWDMLIRGVASLRKDRRLRKYDTARDF
jgi:glycosyltransferase involved in cell wall biosynthesis